MNFYGDENRFEKFLSDHWPLSGVSLGETFPGLPGRRVTRVHAREGEFVVKVDDAPPPFEECLRPGAIFDYLSARRFPHIPGLIKTVDGLPVVYSPAQCVTVMEFIEGVNPEPTPATWQALGELISKLNAFADFPIPYGVPTPDVIRELTGEANQHFAKDQFLEWIDLLRPLVDYPRQGLIHGEIGLRHTILTPEGKMVLIDWDEGGTGATILDPGYPLISHFLTEEFEFHREWAAAFYRGYYGDKTPDAEEEEFLFRASLLHALRYLIYDDPQKRWRRVCYAIEQKDRLLSSIP